jgi:APA family basic amino acid/polyamine antiporter
VPVTTERGALVRRLGFADAVVLGLGAMIGAGVFSALAPAAEAAGSALLLGLGVAAVVAFANATSSARLAARYPESGGTYVYGRERLGPFWGYLAGWAFVIGKTASCAALALTFGNYAWPAHGRVLAVTAVVVLAAVNSRGVEKTARLTYLIVVIVLAALAVIVVALARSHSFTLDRLDISGASAIDVLRAASFMFFAFAGYARIATLGEEVVDPARTIPRAIPVALAITLAVYATVAVAALAAVGPNVLANTDAPLAEAVDTAGQYSSLPIVRIGAAVASLGVLLSLIAGVSRTVLAMARRHELPHALAAIHPRYHVPARAEWAVAAVVVAIVLTSDVRGAIGFSACTVLVYYAVANAAAFTLRSERTWVRALAVVGIVGCVTLAAVLPRASVLGGFAVIAGGALVWLVLRRHP